MRRRLLLTLLALAALAAAPAPAGAAVDSCAKYAALNGSDATGNGTQTTPWRTVDKLLSNLNPGEGGCLIGPGPFVEDVDMEDGGGDPGAPVTLRSANATPVAVRGEFWVRAGVSDFIVAGLKLDGGTVDGISLPIDGDRITLLGNEITRDTNGGACLYAGGGALATDLRVEGNRIHGCSSGVELVHTAGARVSDNVIYKNKIFGVPLYPDADGSIVERNVVAFHGNQGVQFGGLGAAKSDDNSVRRNVISDNIGENLGDNYDEADATGTGNVATENCLDGTAATEIEASSGGFTALPANQRFVADPDYENQGIDDYTLDAGSPCAGRGPLPGVALLPSDTIGTRTARLRGEVNPHSQPVSAYFFRYGTNGIPTTETTHEPMGDEALPNEVRATLDNLQPGTKYTYQLVARNPSGGEAVTPTSTFTTAALPDADGDGVPDETDGCDSTDGPPFDADHNGCPDDSDGDGVLDQSDGCRTLARGPIDRDSNGCPDDSDGDGVADERDACAGLARGAIDRNGDGCPDDTDGDGVFDQADGCLALARGPIDRDGNGCPDDSDGDGLADVDDRCPRLAAGRFDDPPNGCPGPQPIVRARNARLGFFTVLSGSRVTAVRVHAVRLQGVERGARVRISCRGCKIKGKVRMRRGGSLNFKRGLPQRSGRKVGLRSVIVIRVTKRGKAGRQFNLRWNKRQRTWLDAERCIPIGTSKAQPLRACGDRTK